MSFINYKKDGEAFVNLVTIIPIPWDSDEIKYLVGFQVDLERQPGAILRMMGDGSYAVNYSSSADPFPPMSQKLKKALTLGDVQEEARHRFNDFILGDSDDFIHVVSLKGAFQYVSPSVTAILEYTPEELLGKSISDIAHPSDIVPVMRELKESTTQAQPPSLISSSSLAQHYLSQAKLVHLLYRVRRRDSGYIWLECTGRLHVESSKGRKSIVFSGRVKRQPVLPWSLIAQEAIGGPGPGGVPPSNDCWAHVSIDNGLLLYVSSGAQETLGRPAREVQGTPLKDWVAPAWRVAVDAALTEVRNKMEESMLTVENGGAAPDGTLTTITCRRAVPESRSAQAPAITITFFSSYTPLPASSTSSSSRPSTANGTAGPSPPPFRGSPMRSPPLSPPSGPGPHRNPRRSSSASSSTSRTRRQQTHIIRRGVRQSSVVCHIRFLPPDSLPPRSPNVQDYLRPPNMVLNPTPSPSNTVSSSISLSPRGNGISPPRTPDGSNDIGGPSGTSAPAGASNDIAGASGPSNNTNSARIISASLTANVFEELETTRGTSWQYELQQLRIANARMQAEIDEILKQQRPAGGGGAAGTGSRSSGPAGAPGGMSRVS